MHNRRKFFLKSNLWLQLREQ